MKTIKIHFIRCLINRKISLGIIKKLNNCQTTLYWYSQNDLFVHQIFICVSWFLSHEEFWGGMDKWRKCFLLILGEDFSIFLIYQWKKRIASVFSLGELTVRFSAAQVINIVAGCITKEFKEEETSVREWSCRNRWSCKKLGNFPNFLSTEVENVQLAFNRSKIYNSPLDSWHHGLFLAQSYFLLTISS